MLSRDLQDEGMSAAALACRNAYEPDLTPVDFSQIEQRRLDNTAGYAPAADRAAERHALDLEDVKIGGVDCLRIRSRSGGTANGEMLYVYGGGFIVGSPETDLPVLGALAEWCGVEVIAPRYRLAPEHRAPAASDDCMAVYRAMAEHPTPLLLAGESAGGNLALVTSQRAMGEGLRPPAAIALLSPAVDLRTERELFGSGVDADPSLPHQLICDVAQVYPGPGMELDDPAVSPLFGPLEGLPPTILTTGTRDLLMTMTLRLERAMRRAGVDVTCNVWPGMWHVFEFYDEFAESAESLREIAEFLSARFS